VKRLLRYSSPPLQDFCENLLSFEARFARTSG
jgi:hypothetical protein